jgi:myosin heavy subunit
MKKALIAVVIVLGLALVGAIYYCYTLTQDKNALTTELESVKSELASTQAELASTKQTLTTTQNTLASKQAELNSTKGTLASTQTELGATKDKLTATESELDTANQSLNSKLAELVSANNKLTFAEKSVATLQDKLTDTEKKLAAAQETLDGLGITISASAQCSDVELVDNPVAKNPTWKELLAFLSKDKTENHTYIANEYDCSQFSRDVHNNAEAAGFRAAEVQVSFKNEKTGHALNAFLTSDCGLVYVDCTQSPDKIAYVKADKTFKAVPVDLMVVGSYARDDSWWDSLSFYLYIPSSTGGQKVTSRIRIYW